MSVKRKILFSSVILITLFLLGKGVDSYGNSSVMKSTYNAYLLKTATMHLQGIFRGVNEFIIDEGEPLSRELTEKNLVGFEMVFFEIKDNLHVAELRNLLKEQIEIQWLEVKADVESFIRDNPYISADDDEAMLQYGRLITKGHNLLEAVALLADKTQNVAEKTSSKTKVFTNVVASIHLIILTVLLLSFYRSITRPIEDLNKITMGFENGDLSLQMNDASKDEFGILASHFNRAVSKLSDMISKVKEVACILNSNSEKVSESSRQISQNAMEQSAQTSQTASAIEELNTSFIEVAKNAVKAAESSKDTSELALQGGEVVDKTINGMTKISGSVHDSTQLIEVLGKRSEQIGEIIKVINDIAGQTNLLALNAAIEAARAGEQGRGFSVVADEVRKLAERTTTATGDIGDMIKGIQEDTQKAIKSMHAGTTEVKEGVALANQAGETLKQIVASVQNVTDMIRQIAVAAEEQSSTGEEINVTIESVANLTQFTADNAQQSSDATQKLNALAQQLQQLVNEFKLKSDNNNNINNLQEVKIESAIKDQPIHTI